MKSDTGIRDVAVTADEELYRMEHPFYEAAAKGTQYEFDSAWHERREYLTKLVYGSNTQSAPECGSTKPNIPDWMRGVIRHLRLIPRNPFIGLAVPAYLIGGFTLTVTELKPWAWMVWVPWLLIVTIIPVVWHICNLSNKNRN